MSAAASRASKTRTIHRIDGARHWPRTLDQHIELLLLAGVPATEIRKATNVSLRKSRKIRPLAVPEVEALEYSRILTHWQVDTKYLNDQGTARDLAISGGPLSFATLVREGLPGANPTDVLRVLERHRLVKKTSRGRVMMLANAFLPRGEQKGHFLGYTLSAMEGIIDTCHSNITSRNPKNKMGRLQRLVIAERFDLSKLPDYHNYLNDTAAVMLSKHDEWLKRREDSTGKKHKVGYVGVGIFGFRAR